MQSFHDTLPRVNRELFRPFFPETPNYLSFMKHMKRQAKTFHFIGNKGGAGVLFVSIQRHFRYAKMYAIGTSKHSTHKLFTDIILSRFIFSVLTVDFPYLHLSSSIFL
jgi:hypothetical protein